MAENPFRILLDCRSLHFKFFKFVWMSVSPRELVSIKDLKDAILKKFALERIDLQLFLRDGLLPDEENITNILRENDSVRLLYAEPPSVNLTSTRTANYEGIEQNTSDDQGKCLKKRKAYSVSNASEDNNEVQTNKKRKQRISNETIVFDNSFNSENSAVPDSENVLCEDVDSYKNQKQHTLLKNKKNLKYSIYSSPSNSVPANECIPSNDTVLISNENRVNFCKKKKKHKHSKDVSLSSVFENNSVQDIVTISEMNKNDLKSKKKMKKKHTSEKVLTSDTGISICDELITIPGSSGDSLNTSTINRQLEHEKSNFDTIADDSEALKLAPVSFCTSFMKTPEISCSFKGSDKKEEISVEQNYTNSYTPDNESISEQNDITVVQGSNCKKKKRKRHRKRKPLLTPICDVRNYSDFGLSPQENENLNSNSTITDISSKNENTDFSKADTFAPERNSSSSEVKSSISQPFYSFLPSTSTPFSPPSSHVVSSYSRKNVSETPNTSNTSQDQFRVTTTSRNSLVSTVQNRMNANNSTTYSSPYNIGNDKNQVMVAGRNPCVKNLSTYKSSDSCSKNKIKTEAQNSDCSFKTCSSLNSCPVVGTRIAYKVLELDASYSPVVSNYKEGIVKAVNPQTDELEIELIEPEVKEGRTGKFENLYEDECPPSEVIKNVSLSWSSLIDPLQIGC